MTNESWCEGSEGECSISLDQSIWWQI